MIIVQDTDKDVISKKDTLNALAVSINNINLEILAVKENKIKEEKSLNDILTRTDFAKEDFDRQESEQNAIISNYQETIKSLSEDINFLLAKKQAIESEIINISDIDSVKADVKTKIAEFEDEESKKLKALKSQVKEYEDKVEELKGFIDVLAVDYSENMFTVGGIKQELEDLEVKLSSKREELDTLQSNIEDVQAKSTELSLVILSYDEKSAELESKIASLNEELASLEKENADLMARNSKIKEERDTLEKEKLGFLTEKNNILMKEEFIKERYLLAGVKY